jgi:hypothetical protein
MPLEIRELIIRATIASDLPHEQRAGPIDLLALRKQLLRECVAEVVEELSRRERR